MYLSYKTIQEFKLARDFLTYYAHELVSPPTYAMLNRGVCIRQCLQLPSMVEATCCSRRGRRSRQYRQIIFPRA